MCIPRFLLLLILICSGIVDASENSPFSGLKSLSVVGGYPELNPTIEYAPSLAVVVNKRTSNDADVFDVHLLNAFLDQSKKVQFEISYSEGFSMDPHFTLREVGRPDVPYSIAGINLYLPGNGFLYVDGHANNMFNEHRKYTIASGKLVEVKQPFLYVGLRSTAVNALTLYSDQTLTDIVATVPKDGELTVLVSAGNLYLIKTAFGLVGWYMAESAQQDAQTGVRGLYFRGD